MKNLIKPLTWQYRQDDRSLVAKAGFAYYRIDIDSFMAEVFASKNADMPVFDHVIDVVSYNFISVAEAIEGCQDHYSQLVFEALSNDVLAAFSKPESTAEKEETVADAVKNFDAQNEI